jgi:transcriptional regulator with XRE-family HTH domain
MTQNIPTSILKMAREKAKLSQTELAKALSVSSSVVSRLESAEHADGRMAERYLSAIKSDLAADIIDYYAKPWRTLERPPFTHPEKEVIWKAEQAIQKLSLFEQSEKFDPLLDDPISKLRNRLISEVDFVRHKEHGIAFMGDIGVGKTTALSFITNLLLRNSEKPESVFPTGSGRTTVCEIAIKIAPTFGISVDSFSEEDIRALVTDMVLGVKDGKSGAPSELERVIRNMSDLRRVAVRSKTAEEKGKTRDPLKELVDGNTDTEPVVTEILSRMKLSSRTGAQMILSESAEGSIDWLASNISKINYGQHPQFSVPQRITVLLPLKALRQSPYNISVIDTKGVEGTVQRPDLKAQLEDARNVVVLCSKFSDAPGSTPISILRETVESGSEALTEGRLCMLVLPRENEALKIVDDSGTNPASFEEGYAVREAQIEQQLSAEQLPPIPVNFYNAGNDNSEEIWEWLASRITLLRSKRIERIDRLISAADDLVTNSDIAKTRQARITIAKAIGEAAKRFMELPGPVRLPHQNLLVEAKKAHPSSIAASINRRGKWEYFNVSHILGVGVRADANLRTSEIFLRLDEQLESLKNSCGRVREIRQLLDSLKDDLTVWKQDFLNKAALSGRISFAPCLENATKLWKECQERYGEGTGYRVDISDILQKYFEENKQVLEARGKVDAALAKNWRELVITPLLAAVAYDALESEAPHRMKK